MAAALQERKNGSGPKREALQPAASVVAIIQQWNGFNMRERIVAVGLLTRRELNLLGPTFERAWPVEEAPSFSALLRAIDDAERKLQRDMAARP
jgi:hypothetical protein